jgi:methionine synthase I (cobalamin-dependent)
MPKILSGPYGSVIYDQLTKEGVSSRERNEINDPLTILKKDRLKKMVKAITRAYRNNGADVLTTNTFPSRLILKGSDSDLYPSVVRHNLEVVQEIAHEGNQIGVSFGPYGDCYNPNVGPKTISEGQEFWEAAFEPLLSSSGKINYAMAETVNNELEAIAIIKAWQKIQRSLRGKIQGVLSFIPQLTGVNLLSGERIADVIHSIHKEFGSIPVQLGLNCCPIAALEPTLVDVLEDRNASKTGAQFRFIYPNASDLPPDKLDYALKNQISRYPEDAGKILHDLIQKYERSLPGVANHVFINECCGGTPERMSVIAQQVNGNVPAAHIS